MNKCDAIFQEMHQKILTTMESSMTVPPELPIYAQFQPYISRGTQFYLSEEERSYCINELKTIVSKYSNDYEFASALPFYKAALSVLE